MPPVPSDHRAALIAYALTFPEAHLDHPWDEDVVKVRGKIFAFFGVAGPGVSVGLKLPDSGEFALMQSWATPSGYNLARAGWVSIRFEPDEDPPLDVLRSLIDESYRAVAPKRLLKSR